MPTRFLLLLVASLLTAPRVAADPYALAEKIDRLLEARWQSDKIQPAPPADDAEFLRRLTLDITGRIPRPADIHAFRLDTSRDKRRQVIDQLLDEPRFAVHFANVLRADLIPEINSNRVASVFQAGFEAWLRGRLRANIAYDALVRELLTVPIAEEGKDAEPVLRDPERPNPLAFFAIKEARPENLAAAVTRSFLGIQLECAQCHDHPFAKWKQDQFWGQAAFFRGMKRHGNDIFASITEASKRREITPPNRTKVLPAVFLDGAAPTGNASARTALADWITARDNPYFAKAAVNRLWGQLFGVGLVEPVDDFRDDNPASDPDLLDLLAKEFADVKFDLRYMIRVLCSTRAYQRTSARTHPSQDDTRLPARMPTKALTGEQFFDSLALATGYRDDQDKGVFRRQFLSRFVLAGPIGEPETSVQQALTLRNGKFVTWATDPERCPTLLAITQTPGQTTKERLDSLYLTTLSRTPTQPERERLEAFVKSGREADRLADVFWMLLNCAEFRLNH